MMSYAAYVFFVNREDLLQRAIGAFAEIEPFLTVVNNSGKHFPEDASRLYDVFEPPVPLTYSQSMNWMLKDAEGKGVDFILHFHSDAYSTNPTAVKELLEYASKTKAENRRWACLWTLYDVLWVVNPIAARDVGGWDTLFPDYYTDQAFKQRCKRRGWELIDTNIQGIGHDKGDGVGNGQHGSATINSDPQLSFIHGMIDPLYGILYQSMYGGIPGRETTLIPFGRADIFK
jgi:hypothetical protein